MSEAELCPRCQTPLPAGATAANCPKCLLGAVLDAGEDGQTTHGEAVTLVVQNPAGSKSDTAASPLDVKPQRSVGTPRPTPTNLRYFGNYELTEEIARGGM